MRDRAKSFKGLRRSEWTFFIIAGSLAFTVWFLVTMLLVGGQI